MTRILTNEEITEHLPFEDYLSTAETMFEDLGAGQATTNEVQVTMAPVADPPKQATDPTYYGMRTMGGAIPRFGVGGLRINSDVIHWPEGGSRREKLPATEGQYNGFVVLFSASTGEPLLIFPDGIIQTYHVASGVALGAKYLARENASVLGMLGSGHQARRALIALDLVRDIETVKVYSPTLENRQEYAEEMAEVVDASIKAVEDPRTACKNVDILTCATNSLSPVFEMDWISPGTHIGYIKSSEVPSKLFDPDATDTFVLTFPDLRRLEMEHISGYTSESRIEQSKWHYYPIEGEKPIPRLNVREGRGIDPEFCLGLPEVMGDPSLGRSDEDNITVCKQEPRGTDFVAIGHRLHEIAESEGLGTHIPTELFTQDQIP